MCGVIDMSGICGRYGIEITNCKDSGRVGWIDMGNVCERYGKEG